MSALALLLAAALQSAEALPDPDAEARAQDLMREIRCMVCAGESILDSDAPMAADMRIFVRAQVEAGADDAAVRQALVERFGHEVLLRPPTEARTLPLWLAPLAFLAIGGLLLWRAMARRS